MRNSVNEQRKIFDKMALEKGKKLDLLRTLPQYEFFYLYNLRLQLSILDLIDGVSSSTILDLGCGDGEYSSLAALNSVGDIVGIDNSVSSVIAAKRRCKVEGCSSNTDFVVADAAQLPFLKKSFDTVLVLGVFHHLPDFSGLREVVRVVKTEGGTALIHEVVVNNPFALIAKLSLKFVPSLLRNRLLDVASGNVPTVRHFTSSALESAIRSNGLVIVREEREQLFLFIIWYLIAAFPFLVRWLPNRILFPLETIEQVLVSHYPMRSLARFARFLVTNSSEV